MLDSFSWGRGGAVAASLCLVGCASILGLDEYSGSGGAGGSVATTNPTTTADASTTGNGPSSTGSGSCQNNASEPCAYSGPAGTEGKGICQAGKRLCEGGMFGACSGEQLPLAAEDCTNSFDDDCNGLINDTCPCVPDSTQACYGGPAGTETEGTCMAGTQTCNAQGTGYGECVGEIRPESRDNCATPDDENCDGILNDNCACSPGTTEACYSFAAATRGIGECHDGTHACLPDGSGYEATCAGEVGPAAESCANARDEDCNGAACSETKFAYAYGQGGQVWDYPSAIAFDADENLWFAGSFSGTITVDGNARSSVGNGDILLVKYSPSGAVLWFDTFGSPFEDTVFDLEVRDGVIALLALVHGVDFGNGTVAGSLSLATFNTAGQNMMTKSCTAADAYDGALGILSNGDFAIAISALGNVNCGIATTGDTNADILVSRFAANGTQTWVSRYVSSSDAEVKDLLVDASDNLAIAAATRSQMTFNNINVTNAGGTDALLFRVAGNTGITTRAWVWGDSANQSANGIALAADGDYVVVGNCRGAMNFNLTNQLACTTNVLGNDGFAVKLNPAGAPTTFAWSRHFQGVAATRVEIDPSGDLYMSGLYKGTPTFVGTTLPDNGNATFGNAFAAALGPAADVGRWVRGYKSGGTVAVMTLGPRFVGMGGYARGDLNVGTGVIPTGGNPESSDMFVFNVGK